MTSIFDLIADGGSIDSAELSAKIVQNLANEIADEITTGGTDSKLHSSVDAESKSQIDPALSHNLLRNLAFAALRETGFAGHHIDSMNVFYKVGIKQILTKIFAVEGVVKNERAITEEDQKISEVHYKVEFTDVYIQQPTINMAKSGNLEKLLPNLARNSARSYSSQIFVDIKIALTANYKTASAPTTRSFAVSKLYLESIPIMLRSELCHTFKCSKTQLKMLEEDPNDCGGYFIVGGGEWSLSALENIGNNQFHVFKNMYGNEIARGTFLSKPGDAFENSYQIIVRYYNNQEITVEVTTNKNTQLEIPFFVLFRALGMTIDRDIVDNIVFGADFSTSRHLQLKTILEKAFNAPNTAFNPIRENRDAASNLFFIAQKSNEDIAANAKDDNALKYINSLGSKMLDKYILPHVSEKPAGRIKKARFIGNLINELLLVACGHFESTDRDSYAKKRVTAAGYSLAKTFKTAINLSIVQEVRRGFTKAIKETSFSDIDAELIFKQSINNNKSENILEKAIKTGNRDISIAKKEIKNRLASSIVYHKNDLNVIAIVRSINTPNSSAAKQNERADHMRRVHPTYIGYIDLNSSADTGETVGTVKQMTCMATISHTTSSLVLRKTLEEDKDIILLDNVTAAEITAKNLAKVFLNGDWIGVTKSSFALAQKYKHLRRKGMIHAHTTVATEILIRKISFWTDVGRMLRPIVVVNNNFAEYKAAYKAKKPVKFRQWTDLTSSHLSDLYANKITISDLQQMGIIDYIAPEEQENCLIAPSIDDLRAHENDPTHIFTHMDIFESEFGVPTLSAPLANHSSQVRVTYFTNHRKQSANWFALNWAHRIDKNTTLNYYGEQPLITTFTDFLTLPNGCNAIVALALYGGDNQEDSITANVTSIDRGFFNGCHFNSEVAILDKNEQFGNIDAEKTLETKQNVSYEHIDNGIVRIGSIVKKNDVLINKIIRMPQPIENRTHLARPSVYKGTKPAIIDKVIMSRNEEAQVMVKIRENEPRNLGEGDKLCMTDDHEVLTLDGWKPIASVTTYDQICAVDIHLRAKYEFPTATYKYEVVNETLIEISNKYVSQRVTRDHKLMLEFGSTKGDDYIIHDGSSNCGTKGDGSSNVIDANKIFVARAHELSKFINSNSASSNSASNYLHNEAPTERVDIRIPKVPVEMLGYSPLSDDIIKSIVETDVPALEIHADMLTSGLMPNLIASGKVIDFVDNRLKVRGVGKNISLEPSHIREEAYTGSVYCVEVPRGFFIVRRNGRVSITGNSSRTGNKGIISSKFHNIDMPYSEDGTIPDIIVNAHSIPTRMAINQLIECMNGIYAAYSGEFIDLTSFTKIDIQTICIEIEKITNGRIKYGGHRRMFNGVTGEPLDTLLFIGPTTYQRLQKFVLDDNYSVRQGPTSAQTGQPLDGKNQDGGLRIGEMEMDTLRAHGAINTIEEKTFNDSDGKILYFCRNCQSLATVNEIRGIYECKTCGDFAEIVTVRSSVVSNMLFSEIKAAAVKLKFGIEPFSQYKNE